jgi:hypothetical protein
MSKTIDISAKLTNERPVLKLAKDKIYEVDDRKNTILKFQQTVKAEDISDINVIDKLIEMVLGKKAAEEINKMELSMVAYQSIMIAIMAAVAGEEYEVAEKRFREQAKN